MQQRLNETLDFTLTGAGLIEMYCVDLKDFFFYLDGFSSKGFYIQALEQSGQLLLPHACSTTSRLQTKTREAAWQSEWR